VGEFTVKLFASVREAVGQDTVQVQVEDGASVADLLEVLAAQHPGIARHRQALSVAVNHAISPSAHQLSPGDELALIPPVGGG
jgi:molybdopterin converting factor subunit 1